MIITIPVINLSWHGGTRVLIELANHLADAGHRVELLVCKGYVSGLHRLSRKVQLKYVGIHFGYKFIDYAAFLFIVPFLIPRKSMVLANFFVTYHPAKFGAWLNQGHVAYLVQDIETKYSGIGGSLLNLICARTYKEKTIITVNHDLQRRLRKEFGARAFSVDIGPVEPFFSQPRLAEMAAHDVLYFARREPWKGLDRFMEFANQNKTLSFLCVSQDRQLLDELQQRGIPCACPANDTELIRIIDRSRLLLFTSSDEGLGLPPLEAMARGLPCVLYPSQGPKTYAIDRFNALYVTSTAECEVRVSELLNSPDLYAEISRNGKSTAARFRMSLGLERIRKFMESSSV